jgi:hypothetical protein
MICELQKEKSNKKEKVIIVVILIYKSQHHSGKDIQRTVNRKL